MYSDISFDAFKEMLKDKDLNCELKFIIKKCVEDNYKRVLLRTRFKFTNDYSENVVPNVYIVYHVKKNEVEKFIKYLKEKKTECNFTVKEIYTNYMKPTDDYYEGCDNILTRTFMGDKYE